MNNICVFFGVVVGLCTTHKLFRFYRSMFSVQKNLLTLASQKRQQRDKLIQSFLQNHPLTPEETIQSLDILAVPSATVLSQLLKNRQWSVELVIKVYIHKAIKVHQLTNCLTEVLFEEALQEARQLDASLDSTLDTSLDNKGSLFGVPISIKDSLNIRGQESSMGSLKLIGIIKDEDADVVKALRQEGAVIFAKTNVPQTLLTFECENPLWGRTINPMIDGQYSPGGSTGGESALIKGGGSIVGIGSDIGGSLRNPAHFCGIYALKPTHQRVSLKGLASIIPPRILLTVSTGPMARCVDDLVAISKVIFGYNIYSGFSFNESNYYTTRPLRFGVLYSYGYIDPTPACDRATREAASALESAGYEVVPINLPFDPLDVICLSYSLLCCDGCQFFLEVLEGEPKVTSIKPFMLTFQLNPTFYRFLLWIFSFVVKDQRLLSFLRQFRPTSIGEAHLIQQRCIIVQRDFIEYWKTLNIDLLITPAMVLPATPYNSFKDLNFTAGYNLIWNFFNFPVGIVPVTEVDPEKDKKRPIENPNAGPSIFRRDFLERMVHKYYDPIAMKGLPVGVQVIGTIYSDELVLRGMKVLELALKSKLVEKRN